MPSELVDRPKMGFAVPVGAWFRGDLGDTLPRPRPGARCRHPRHPRPGSRRTTPRRTPDRARSITRRGSGHCSCSSTGHGGGCRYEPCRDEDARHRGGRLHRAPPRPRTASTRATRWSSWTTCPPGIAGDSATTSRGSASSSAISATGRPSRAAVDGVEVVLHEAAVPSVARSIADPRRSNDVNVNGTVELVLAAAAAGVRRVVLAGSSSVYGSSGVPAAPGRPADRSALPVRREQAGRRALRAHDRCGVRGRVRRPALLQRLRPGTGPDCPSTRPWSPGS